MAFRLRGTGSNRDAVGAVVKLYAGKEALTRMVSPDGGHLSQSSKTVHFGLGGRTQVGRVEARWPGGRTEPSTRPAINRLHANVEGEQK